MINFKDFPPPPPPPPYSLLRAFALLVYLSKGFKAHLGSLFLKLILDESISKAAKKLPMWVLAVIQAKILEGGGGFGPPF